MKTADAQTPSDNIWLALAEMGGLGWLLAWLAGFGVCVLTAFFIFKMKRRLQNVDAGVDEEAEREIESTSGVVDLSQREYNTIEKAEDEEMEKTSSSPICPDRPPPPRPSSLPLGAPAPHKLKLPPLPLSSLMPSESIKMKFRRRNQWKVVSKKKSMDKCTLPTLMPSAKKFTAMDDMEEAGAKEEATNELNEMKEVIRKMHDIYQQNPPQMVCEEACKKESEKMEVDGEVAHAGQDDDVRGATGQDDDVNDEGGEEVVCAEEVEKGACGEDGRKMVCAGGGGGGEGGDADINEFAALYLNKNTYK